MSAYADDDDDESSSDYDSPLDEQEQLSYSPSLSPSLSPVVPSSTSFTQSPAFTLKISQRHHQTQADALFQQDEQFPVSVPSTPDVHHSMSVLMKRRELMQKHRKMRERRQVIDVQKIKQATERMREKSAEDAQASLLASRQPFSAATKRAAEIMKGLIRKEKEKKATATNQNDKQTHKTEQQALTIGGKGRHAVSASMSVAIRTEVELQKALETELSSLSLTPLQPVKRALVVVQEEETSTGQTTGSEQTETFITATNDQETQTKMKTGAETQAITGADDAHRQTDNEEDKKQASTVSSPLPSILPQSSAVTSAYNEFLTSRVSSMLITNGIFSRRQGDIRLTKRTRSKTHAERQEEHSEHRSISVPNEDSSLSSSTSLSVASADERHLYQLLTFLSRIPLFADLPLSCFLGLAQHVHLQTFDEFEVIANEGETSDYVYFIKHGQVTVKLNLERLTQEQHNNTQQTHYHNNRKKHPHETLSILPSSSSHASQRHHRQQHAHLQTQTQTRDIWKQLTIAAAGRMESQESNLSSSFLPALPVVPLPSMLIPPPLRRRFHSVNTCSLDVSCLSVHDLCGESTIVTGQHTSSIIAMSTHVQCYAIHYAHLLSNLSAATLCSLHEYVHYCELLRSRHHIVRERYRSTHHNEPVSFVLFLDDKININLKHKSITNRTDNKKNRRSKPSKDQDKTATPPAGDDTDLVIRRRRRMGHVDEAAVAQIRHTQKTERISSESIGKNGKNRELYVDTTSSSSETEENEPQERPLSAAAQSMLLSPTGASPASSVYLSSTSIMYDSEEAVEK